MNDRQVVLYLCACLFLNPEPEFVAWVQVEICVVVAKKLVSTTTRSPRGARQLATTGIDFQRRLTFNPPSSPAQSFEKEAIL